MCGRFAQVVKYNQLKKFIDELAIKNKDEQIEVNFNVAPTQAVSAVIEKQGERLLTHFRWGLIPSWSKEPNPKFPMINVRAETILEKPTFKNALLRRRCLIPATGFYEWRKTDKQPFFIHSAICSAGFQSCEGDDAAGLETCSTDFDLLMLAGITEYWTGADGSYVPSLSIITTTPNAVMQPIHDRMPVILPIDSWETWLKESFTDPASLQALLVPCSDDLISSYPVSKFVNSIAHNSEDCLKPV